MRRAKVAVFLVAAAAVTGMAACSSGSGGSDLVGPTWQWSSGTLNQPKHQFVVSDPGNYTITFADDGSFQAKADCNSVHGTYTTSGDSLSIKPGASTLVGCGPESQGDQFVTLLGTVGSFAVDGSNLTMTLAADAGELQFQQA